jgi:hypothetical protein
MIPHLDIYRAAKLLVDQHGTNAAAYAAGRADQPLKDGDAPGRFASHRAATWE